MRVKMKTILATPDYNAGIGVIIDLPDDMAMYLVKNNYAEAEKSQVIETADNPPVQETTDSPKRKGKK